MTMPLAALVLQTVAATMVSRCESDDVNRCTVVGAENLVTVSSLNHLRSDRVGRHAGFGTPSSSLTLTFLKNNVPAWADLEGAKLKHPPMEVDGIPVFMPSAQFKAGSVVHFHCPSISRDVCDAWVFFYSCPQSCTIAYQGGIQSKLAAEGWEHTLCAPQFVTGVPSGYAHHMRSYRMKMAPGQTVALTLDSTSEFLAFGVDMQSVDCSKLKAEATCTAAPHGSCVWSPMGECLATRCRRGGQGPPPPCTECPWQGIVNDRPASDGPFN